MKSVQSRPREGTVLLVGLSPMEPMTAREAYELGALLIDHAREVARIQLEMRGGAPPPIETVPSFEPVGDRGARPANATLPSAGRRRHNQPQPRQGKAHANHQAAVLTVPPRPDLDGPVEPDARHGEPAVAGHAGQ